MKIIDEKGRLFGKLNLIDLLVILLIAAVAVFGVWKFANRDTDAPRYSQSLNKPLTYCVAIRAVYRDSVDAAMKEVGQPLMAAGKIIDTCHVTNVEQRPYYESYVDAEGNLQYAESLHLCDLVFTIEGEAPFVDNAFQVGTQEVRVGKAHIMKTVNLEMNGTIITLEAGE